MSNGLAWQCFSLLLALPVSALAGEVKLVSDTLDLVCSVEVSSGPEAPDDANSEFHTDVKKGWSITRAGKLCYRRPTTPDNCDSGMTQWRTAWKCEESKEGMKEMSLK